MLFKANEELAKDSTSTEEDRERKVLFKAKLVDLEAPPDDYSSSSSSEDEEDIQWARVFAFYLLDLHCFV